jgi:hypothetical protein
MFIPKTTGNSKDNQMYQAPVGAPAQQQNNTTAPLNTPSGQAPANSGK